MSRPTHHADARRWVAIGALLPGTGHGAWELNLSPGVTASSREIFDLHMLIFWICVTIAIVVFTVMFVAIVRFRKSRGAVAANFHDNTFVEILWTAIPVLILIAIAVPATRTILALEDTRSAEVTVQVTGYQWKWRYDYLEHGVGFFSTMSTPREQIRGASPKGEHYLLEVDRPLVLPIGRKVRFLTTSNDVIHSWWVPAFGVKKDAVPGFINEAWARIDAPGTYRGQCAELCGKDHAFMPIVVEAVTEEAFRGWIAERRAEQAEGAAAAARVFSRDELIGRGEAIYKANCAACHREDGKGIPGVFPALVGGKSVAGPADGHVRIVLFGRPGTSMQAFGKQLDDVDLAAVVTYERYAFGGEGGDVVQPRRVAELRAGEGGMKP